MVAALFMHPIAIALGLGVVFLCGLVLYSGRGTAPPLSKRQLALGYLGIVLVCLGIAAASTYVSPEEALAQWHVPAEHYWGAILNEFVAVSVALAYLSVIGTAVIGAPIIFALARRGFGTVPCVLGASIIISLLGAVVLVWFSQPSSASFTRDAPYFVGTHLLLALGFCVGAGLPWSFRARNA